MVLVIMAKMEYLVEEEAVLLKLILQILHMV